ncbi:hypothetical protein LX81_03532 [Palleronia aestuarii]|uniref:Uncharacterized protein n=1 Tax=Palleronia aestuarii TaxID=568105 RepID=A0A2W7MXE3_9RHOB|nr:restriction endonuclease subunit S [Palleronia aestuarii]PZX12825.1 hypothetical protein LX81_03532 [Palleronia aestuarii]
MNLEGILREAGLLTFAGLAGLFRIGLLRRCDQLSRIFVENTDIRLGVEKFASKTPGVLTDGAVFLDGQSWDNQFEYACDLISLASDDGVTSSWPDRNVAKKFVSPISLDKVTRFSFEPAIHPCLLHARDLAALNLPPHRTPDYPVRYAGIGEDVRLMAFATRFLDLRVYVDTGPPWERSVPFEEDEPSTDDPDIEISFPPNKQQLQDMDHLKASVLAMRVPQSLARGRLDVESVMLRYLSQQSASARIVVSENVLAGRRRSNHTVRSELVEARRIKHITELPLAPANRQPDSRFILDLDTDDHPNASFVVRRSDLLSTWPEWTPTIRERRGAVQQVSYDEVRAANGSLAPVRFLSTGPLRGGSIAKIISRGREPERVRLSDVFDVIRPKTTRGEQWGEERVTEVTPSDISDYGEILGTSRKISVREGIFVRLEEQKLRVNDIVLALKGPVGRVGHIPMRAASEERHDWWASQSLVIIRAKRRTAAEAGRPSCDPRLLFMYLLTPLLRNHWRDIATNPRSPTIPLEEIERLALPEGLYKIGTLTDTRSGEEMAAARTAILAEFDTLRNNLLARRELDQQLDDGLAKVCKLTSDK